MPKGNQPNKPQRPGAGGSRASRPSPRPGGSPAAGTGKDGSKGGASPDDNNQPPQFKIKRT